jgi:hypothetical protein
MNGDLEDFIAFEFDGYISKLSDISIFKIILVNL